MLIAFIISGFVIFGAIFAIRGAEPDDTSYETPTPIPIQSIKVVTLTPAPISQPMRSAQPYYPIPQLPPAYQPPIDTYSYSYTVPPTLAPIAPYRATAPTINWGPDYGGSGACDSSAAASLPQCN